MLFPTLFAKIGTTHICNSSRVNGRFTLNETPGILELYEELKLFFQYFFYSTTLLLLF